MTSYTEKHEGDLFGYSFDPDNCTPILSYLNEDFSTFSQSLDRMLQATVGIDGSSGCEFLLRISRSGKDRIASENTIRSWYRFGNRPKKSQDSREMMFRIAFALSFSPQQTSELFNKVYLDRACNYRNFHEVIYYYCLQRGLPYSRAQKLIADVEPMICPSPVSSGLTTRRVASAIASFVNEEELLSFFKKNGHFFIEKSTRTLDVRDKYYAKAAKTAVEHAAVLEDSASACPVSSANFVYAMITGQNVTGSHGTVKVSFKGAEIPKEISSNFPQASSLTARECSTEEIRKCIILLFSYEFW